MNGIIVSKIDSGGLARWEKAFSVFRILEIAHFVIQACLFLLSIFNGFKLIYGFLIMIVFVIYGVQRNLKQLKGRMAKENFTTMLSQSGIQMEELSYKNLNRSPPLEFIRMNYHLQAFISFSKAINDTASDSETFSDDDLGLIRFWISNDSDLLMSLQRYNIIQEEAFAILLFILSEKSDVTSTQWCQLCEI
ncbi:MAG: hypothetical protein ACO3MI_07050, partial [Candidatus Poseidoniaceae archaeon]